MGEGGVGEGGVGEGDSRGEEEGEVKTKMEVTQEEIYSFK